MQLGSYRTRRAGRSNRERRRASLALGGKQVDVGKHEGAARSAGGGALLGTPPRSVVISGTCIASCPCACRLWIL